MVSPIDASQVIARLTALVRQASRPPDPRTRAAAAGAPRERATTLRERLRAVPAGSPKRQAILSRLLVEELLVQEFGESAVNEVGFQGIVDSVIDTFDRSPALAADLVRVTAAIEGTGA